MIADWVSWKREAAILHLFLHITNDDEAKKIAHIPDEDCSKLIEELNKLDAAP